MKNLFRALALLFCFSAEVFAQSVPGSGSSTITGGTGCTSSGTAILKGDGIGGCANAVDGVDFYAIDDELTAIKGVVSAANKLPYFTGLGTAAVTDFTAYARTLLDDVDAATARATLGLGTIATQNANNVSISGGTISGTTLTGYAIGSDIQAFDADLSAIAALGPTDDNLIVGSGVAWEKKALTTCTGTGKAVTYDAATNTFGCNTISGAPGGADTQVQFNDGGAFGGDAGMVFNKTTNVLSVSGDVIVGTQSVCLEDGTNCPSAGAESDPVVGAITGLVKANGAGTISAAVAGTDYVIPAGNVATATALASNPTDCSADQFANAIAANGNLTCAQVASTQLSDTGNLVRKNASNAFSTGAQDLSSATSLKIPTAAGAAPTVSATIAYDSTSNTLEAGVNGANKTVAFLDSTVALASALAANGTNCAVGQAAGGVDASGNAENCFTPSASAAGADTQVQFNDGGSALGGDPGLTFNKTTNVLTATGGFAGNATTATALAANGANCSAGSAPLGVDASGAVEGCANYMEEPAGNGIVVRTAANTSINRTITGTSNNISVTFGDGTGGNPTIDVGTNIPKLDSAASITGAWNFAGGTTTGIDHGALSGLGDDDHIAIYTRYEAGDESVVAAAANCNRSAEFKFANDTNKIFGCFGNGQNPLDLGDLGDAYNQISDGTNSGTAAGGETVYFARAPALTREVEIFNGTGTFTNQPANDGIEVVSSNAGDTTQTVTIYGTTNGSDESNLVIETLTLNGTTFVPSVKVDWNNLKAVKLSAVAAGTVTIREASGDATITTISAGNTRAANLDTVINKGFNSAGDFSLTGTWDFSGATLVGVTTSESDTLDTVFDRGKIIDGANTKANAAQIGDSVNRWLIYRDSVEGLIMEPSTPTDARTRIQADKTWCLWDVENSRCLETVDPDAATTKEAWVYNAQKPRKSIWWDAGSISTDGANCGAPTEQTLNGGPKTWAFSCADNNFSTFDGKVRMPDSYDGGNVEFRLSLYHATTETITFAGDFAAMCRRDGDVIDGTYGTAVAADVSITTAHQNEQQATAAVTPNGTCAGGAMLFWRYTVDAANFSPNAANAKVLGVNMEYSINSRSD